MTPRERVLCALNHQEPDRTPIGFGGGPATIEVDAYEELKQYLNISSETVISVRCHVIPDEVIMNRFQSDFRFVRLKTEKPKMALDNSYVDAWGVTWKKPPSSLYYDMVDHPIKNPDLQEIKHYKKPNFNNPDMYRQAKREAEKLRKENYFAIGTDLVCFGIFEQAWALRGFENFLLDLALYPDFVKELLEKILNIQIKLFDRWLEAVGKYIDVITVSDDMGTQENLIVSAKMYREFIKPYQKRLFDFIKSKTNAYLLLHSCGSVYLVIQDFIDIGVDILNPVQPMAKGMDTRRMKEEFGDKLVFWGGVDTQHVLCHESVEGVRQEVRQRINDLGPGGGYILSPAHNIQYGVRPENIIAMVDEAVRYGKYPLPGSKYKFNRDFHNAISGMLMNDSKI